MSASLPEPSSHTPAPMTFAGLLSYLSAARLRLFLFGALGLGIGAAVYWFLPKYYEASFILKMPTANGVSSLGEIEKHIIKPVPPSLDGKKLLLRPEEFPLAVLEACGMTDRNDDRKRLVSLITVYEVNYATAVQVAVRIPGREQVRTCANALLAYEVDFANTQKERYVRYVRDANKLGASALIVNESAQLTAPIRVSDAVVYPRLTHLLLGCCILGLLLACLIDWVRFLWSRAR